MSPRSRTGQDTSVFDLPISNVCTKFIMHRVR